jgi:Zn-dependent M16 (insulinase) family peptidase
LNNPNEFTVLQESNITVSGIRLSEYVHESTGARHIHFSSNDQHNAFMVAFLTLPFDSSGVAHILEHTTLCGSESYPVRDPFFMMLRRSLNTYMNAFTGSDTTAYPFATQNRKDFDNLMRVYLDAVFFPELNILDFAQEGWRKELINKDGERLEYHGVVFNEMKGAMSSPIANLWQHLYTSLFPDTPYRHNSGGDPAHIPNLSHQDLLHFHSKHYNPSNAIFMTYGNFPCEEHQKTIQKLVLDRFHGKAQPVVSPLQTSFKEPICTVTEYCVDSVVGRSTHIVWAWVLGQTSIVSDCLEAHFLSSIFLEHSGSPVKRYLETTELANAPSDLCGIDDSAKQLIFFCGVEGSERQYAENLESGLSEVFLKLKRDGIPLEEISSIIDRIEMAQRDLGDGSYPYGLRLMGRILPAAVHKGEIREFLDLDRAIDRLRTEVQSDAIGYIRNLVDKLIINNSHRARVIMVPSSDKAARDDAAEKANLAAMLDGLDSEERDALVSAAESLRARQRQVDDAELLPKVDLADIPTHQPVIRPSRIFQKGEVAMGGAGFQEYEVAANGIFRAKLALQLSDLTESEIRFLPLWSEYITEFGAGDNDYLSMQAKRSVVGDFSVYSSIRPDPSKADSYRGWTLVSGKGLARNKREIIESMQVLVSEARFDEEDRLKDLVMQSKADAEQSVTEKGHQLAILTAGRDLSSFCTLCELWDGVSYNRFIKQLAEVNPDQTTYAEIFRIFESIRQKVLKGAKEIALIGDAPILSDIEHSMFSGDFVADESPTDFSPLDLDRFACADENAWIITSGVNFCARVFPAVSLNSPDAPALSVLSRYLQDGFLHQHIREQGGAYGGGASYDGETATFRFYSYRDPRLSDTFQDFIKSLDWFLADTDPRRLEESILGTIRTIDIPLSLAGEAEKSFNSDLFGYSENIKKKFREGVLRVTKNSLLAVCEKYLLSRDSRLGVLASSAYQSVLERDGFVVGRL